LWVRVPPGTPTAPPGGDGGTGYSGGRSSTVESWIVIPVVVGSNPIGHPISKQFIPPPCKWIQPPMQAAAGAVFAANVSAAVAHVRANARGAALGHDPEYLHQVRVGVRRLRSTLRVFRGLLRRRGARQFERELRARQRVLGAARDWDEFVGAGFEPVLRRAARRPRAVAQQSARKTLAGASFDSVLQEVLAWSGGKPWRAGSGPDESPEIFARRALQRLYRASCRRAAGIDWADAELRHRLRIRLKRLRYGCECFAAEYRPEQTRRLLHRLHVLQRILGELNDIQVQRMLLSELARNVGVAPPADMAGQALDARERRLIRGVGKSWSKFEAVRPYWRRRAARAKG
jgi:triphosphatase